MKKIAFLAVSVLIFTLVYGYKQPAENDSKTALKKEAVTSGNSGTVKTEAALKNSSQNKSADRKPEILKIVTGDRNRSAGSYSFLKSCVYGRNGQNGC